MAIRYVILTAKICRYITTSSENGGKGLSEEELSNYVKFECLAKISSLPAASNYFKTQ